VADEKEKQDGEEARHGGGVFKWVWIVGVMLVLYVLSVGPVMKLVQFRVVRPSVVDVAYSPVFWLTSQSLLMDRFYQWYVFRVWRVRVVFNNVGAVPPVRVS